MSLFYTYHYAVHSSWPGRPAELELFEREADALKRAKFLLWNCDTVTVYQLEDKAFVGREIYRTDKKLKLKKLKPTPQPC